MKPEEKISGEIDYLTAEFEKLIEAAQARKITPGVFSDTLVGLIACYVPACKVCFLNMVVRVLNEVDDMPAVCEDHAAKLLPTINSTKH